MMAAKLKKLSVTSVDLVDQGANPDAHICLFKRAEPMDTEKMGEENQPAQDACAHIIEREDTGTMEENKMTPAENASAAEETAKSTAQDTPANDGLHPEVQKALADFRELAKRQSSEIEELKKSLEIERLTAFAKKYEVLGKNAGELAAKLYEMKKTGGSAYDEYVALLDESAAVVQKSGIFGEIGKNMQGSAGAAQSIQMKAAELAKSAAGGMASTDAVIKAFEENPELAAQYEAEYMGGN